MRVNHETIISAKMSFFKNLFKEVFASLSHSATSATFLPAIAGHIARALHRVVPNQWKSNPQEPSLTVLLY